MTISFRCPRCQKVLRAPDEKAGAQVKCRDCKQPMQVPPPAMAHQGERVSAPRHYSQDGKQNGPTSEAIAVLEQCCREEPDNTKFQRHLAIAYHDAVFLGWTEVREGHPLLQEGICATEHRHIADAQACLQKAFALNVDDPKLRESLEDKEQFVRRSARRQFTCNWGVAIIVALLGIILMATSKGSAIGFAVMPVLSVLYVISSFAPQYRINERLARGKEFKEFAFLASVSEAFGKKEGREDWQNLLIVLLGLWIMCMLLMVMMPVVMMVNFYNNWINVR